MAYKRKVEIFEEAYTKKGKKSILSYDGRDGKKRYIAGSSDPDVEPGGGGSGIESIEQTVTSEESGGVNVITVTTSDGATTDFQVRNGMQGATGPKGDQGNSGYSGVAGELEVVNNLTDGGEESALSAEMGKTLAYPKGVIEITPTTSGYIGLGGDTVTPTPVSSTGWFCSITPCTEGDFFHVSGQGNTSGAKLYGFADAEYNVLCVTETGSTAVTDKIVIAPKGSAYIILNNKKGNTSRSFKGMGIMDCFSNYTRRETFDLSPYMRDKCYFAPRTFDYASSNTNKALLVPCKEGFRFYVNSSTGNSTRRALYFFDANHEILESAIVSFGYYDAPVGCAYIAVTGLKSAADFEFLSFDKNYYYELFVMSDVISKANEVVIDISYRCVDSGYIKVDGGVGSKVSYNIQSGSNFHHGVLWCIEGTPLSIMGSGGAAYRLYTFVDKDDIIISQANANTNKEDIVAPAGTSKVIITSEGFATVKTSPSGATRLTDARFINTIDPFANFNLNEFSVGRDNQCWSWWIHPHSFVCKRRDTLVWGWTDSEGYSGVASLEIGNGTTKRVTLKYRNTDDHDAPAVIELQDRKIGVVYADGHASDNHLFIRISEAPENVDKFGDSVVVTYEGKTTYAQCFYINGKYYIFCRVTNADWEYPQTWQYIESTDFVNWSQPKAWLKATPQYYCRMQLVTDRPNVLRVAMTSNPEADDPNVRLAYIDFESGNIYNGAISSDKIVGNMSNDAVLNTSFDIIVSCPSGATTQRLLDVAASPYADVRIAVAQGVMNSTTPRYYIYNNGSLESLCIGGLFKYGYQSGVTFVNPDKVVVSRTEDDNDIIDAYIYQNGVWSHDQELYRENTTKDGEPWRNVRPFADETGRFVLWQRGFYSTSNYVNFDMDAMIYDLSKGKLV